MPFYRLAVVLLALGFSSCTSCGKAPVQNSLKPDGEACGADEECESSLCDKLPGKASVCFKKCSAGCKTGDICTALAANDRFACVPEVPGLCQSCALNVDCPYPGDRCLEIGGTKVCSRDCSFDGQCPSSYRCADGTDTNGTYVTKQCQPTSGTCECVAASAGQTTPCAETNTFGTCMGVRTCRPPNGYEACTAPVPTTESCNGRDDDCNGMTDEDLGDTTCGTGECRRTITNCVNGAPQQCDPLPPGTETCNNKDDDCDGVIDEGFDKQTSLLDCGACGALCTRPNATPVCLAGMCGIGACNLGWVNADGVDVNGCELMCTITGAEICDGIDNDCDGLTDEGFTLASDPTNCGSCGRVCSVNNGNIMSYACVASQCGIMNCSTGFADCDQLYSTGCELSVSADVQNCGACNNVCTTPNATPACASSACAIGTCNATYANCDLQVANGCEIQISTDVDHCGSCPTACPMRNNATRTCVAGGCGFSCSPGWVNLDGLASNGCEYGCTGSGVDLPELNFGDTNCDGIDGDAAQAIFVSLTGNDISPGTRATPKRTINTAISAAAAMVPKRAVYVSKGVYNEAVVMQPGVSLYGGYDAAAGWSRSLTNTTTIASGSAVGVLAQSISLAAELQLFTVIAANATGTEANGDGRSSIGIHIVDSMAGVTVHGCTVTAGNGSAGANGATGTTGTVGGTGGVAGLGGITVAGAGGSSACNAGGGRGGVGVSGETNGNPGIAGTQAGGGGAAGNPGSGGAAGTCGGISSSSGYNAPPVTAGGIAGNPGLNGIANGALGSVSSGSYVPTSGLAGAVGHPGGGAGGGGSGGGSANGASLPFCSCSNLSSGGGGGGGGGGCGGSSGTPGRGGGGSFAILVANSTATVTNTTLVSSSGGRGGAGGAGGLGGGGGPGGPGTQGQNRNSSCSNRSGGDGANGAAGGGGGRGGGGSGGAGGPSIGLAYSGTPPTTSGNTSTTGVGGLGGTGGTNGLQNAASGPVGVVTQAQSL